jgi:hypothetical protein
VTARATCVFLICAAVVPVAGAHTDATRIVDQTFTCSVRLWAGERPLVLSATSGLRDPLSRRQWKFLGNVGVGIRDGSLAWIAAGAPAPAPPSGGSRQARWLAVTAERCRPSGSKVALTARSLGGGKVSQLADRYECRGSASVLVRLRAETGLPTTLKRQRRYREIVYTTSDRAIVKRGELAVATPTGKPLAYASVSENGAATLFTARSCVPD